MTPEQVLMITMVDAGMVINPGTLASLKEAIEEDNIYFFDKNGEASGFVTWFLEGNVLEVNNLCLFESGINKLFELRKFFHTKYPNLTRVKWHDDKKGKDIEYGLFKDESNTRPVSAAENTSS